MAMDILPDVVAPELDILFCGTAAGSASARRGAYYAGAGNAFWRTLHRVGLTPRALAPEEFRQVIDWRLGLTDLAKTVSGSDLALEKTHFNAARLNALVLHYQPCFLAFTSKRAAQEFLGHPVGYGLMTTTLGATRLFVLPSPSGAARGSWDEGQWQSLAAMRRTAR
jgi:TDG/mug DNA glycosylase family protein